MHWEWTKWYWWEIPKRLLCFMDSKSRGCSLWFAVMRFKLFLPFWMENKIKMIGLIIVHSHNHFQNWFGHEKRILRDFLPLKLWINIFLLNNFLLLFYYSCPNFPASPSSTHPTTLPKVNSHTVVHVRGSFISVLCLVPSPSFHHYSLPPTPLVTFSLFYVSMSVVLFCSLVYLVQKTPLIGEIIWHWSPKHIWNSYDSTPGRQTIQLKNGQRIWIDSSPRRIYRGPVDIWKDAQHH